MSSSTFEAALRFPQRMKESSEMGEEVGNALYTGARRLSQSFWIRMIREDAGAANCLMNSGGGVRPQAVGFDSVRSRIDSPLRSISQWRRVTRFVLRFHSVRDENMPMGKSGDHFFSFLTREAISFVVIQIALSKTNALGRYLHILIVRNPFYCLFKRRESWGLEASGII